MFQKKKKVRLTLFSPSTGSETAATTTQSGRVLWCYNRVPLENAPGHGPLRTQNSTIIPKASHTYNYQSGRQGKGRADILYPPEQHTSRSQGLVDPTDGQELMCCVLKGPHTT